MIGSELSAVALGLASAMSWGAGDFSGGLAARRANVFLVVALSQGVGLLLVTAIALVIAERIPPAVDLAWGGAAGLLGALGLTAFYRALATGQMAVVAPITAVLAAALPVFFAAFAQGLPQAINIVGFVLAIIGVWFLSRTEGSIAGTRGLGLAILAGVGFGGFFILINQASTHAVFWPLVADRIVATSVMLVIAFLSRRAQQSGATPWLVIVLAGILDMAGNVFFVLAAQVGRLDVAAVIASLYPMFTVLLARLILRERLTRMQALGIVLALVALPLIAVS